MLSFGTKYFVLKSLLSKNVKLKIQFCLLFCMVVKLGFLTLREQRRLRVFHNRVLRRMFGSKRNEITGE